MAKILMRRTEIYRADSLDEAQEIIDEAEEGGNLTKKSVELKQKKSKGEVIAEAQKVIIQLDYSTDWFESEIVSEVD